MDDKPSSSQKFKEVQRKLTSCLLTLVILDKDGTADEVASDLPVTLSRRSAAYLQNCAWSAALSSITGSLIRTLTKYK